MSNCITGLINRVARNFCWSLFSGTGNFLCFEETTFCDLDRLDFLVMNEFLRFSESPAKSLIMYEKTKGG